MQVFDFTPTDNMDAVVIYLITSADTAVVADSTNQGVDFGVLSPSQAVSIATGGRLIAAQTSWTPSRTRWSSSA